MNKILFTGHRDAEIGIEELEELCKKFRSFVWIHGGANGFDNQIEQCAKLNGITTEIYRPDYKKYHPKKAPLIRNLEMIEQCSTIVACYDGRTTGGTYFTIKEAKKRNKTIVQIIPHHHISK